ncbi:MAG: hypothetical protein JWP89_4157 [Schlesneria sp.]|nr:hypothetical protein [Schlesneria sp.]
MSRTARPWHPAKKRLQISNCKMQIENLKTKKELGGGNWPRNLDSIFVRDDITVELRMI